MKKGDLRRFTVNDSGAVVPLTGERWSVGDIFMVLEVLQPRSSFPKQVTFLVGDRIEEGWGLPWIMNTSEALDETG